MQVFEQPQRVEGFGPGFFRVAGRLVRGPMLLTMARLQPWGGLQDRAALEALAGEADVLFLGMGPEMALAPAGLPARLAALGIGVEPMATEVALRAFNQLLGDARRIALAAVPV